MKNIHPRRTIQPTISTVPRYKSEASEQLELYKMVTKRQRIQQELQFMEQRLQLLKQQLSMLDSQIEKSEKNIQKLRQSTPISSPTTATPQKSVKSSNFQTFHFEY
ncbi:gas vesicle protein [Iningainema tapete]|uniref:Gas vesicle protein n=1 Tax=Iningainema tapete BLCC-T55 TaxID=2748662 RepID=A0A8J6XCI1_9CYAN|nr:gas vesicle protein [Iningainema tapete]MBD2773090.1 gas vesicle protein [Iningainema tapete BLCC-T55]